MTTPDVKTVNDLALEVATIALHDAVHVDHWISAVVASRFGNECSQVRAPLHAAVARRMAGVKPAWTDEFPEEFECEVCTKPITSYPCILCGHEADPWKSPDEDWPAPSATVEPDKQPQTERDLFADIADITAWLDDSNPASPHEDSMRVLKLVEEAGEAAGAYIGMVGQNPRKGVTHNLVDLLDELADVAITALCAMQHFTQDEAVTRAHMAAKVREIVCRSDIQARAGA